MLVVSFVPVSSSFLRHTLFLTKGFYQVSHKNKLFYLLIFMVSFNLSNLSFKHTIDISKLIKAYYA